MKINILGIIKDHYATFVNPNGKIVFFDYFIFLGIPSLLFITSYLLKWSVTSDIFNTSISIFSIFSALLFNVQIALFSIYQRKWTEKADNEQEINDIKLRNEILRELNTNISYLIITSCVCVTIFFASQSINGYTNLKTSILIFLYTHFILSLMMVIKRAYALFQNEYCK